jgi:hypothetical protein
LGRFRRGTSRGFVGAIVVTALIVVVFFVPLPHVSLFKRLVRPTQLPTAAAPIPVGTQLAELKGSDAVAGDEFGSSVAISATTAVVGAPGFHNGAGRAYVFAKTTAGWKQVAELKGSDTVAGDRFGESVAVSGHTVVVGAPGDAQQPRPAKNASAYVFTETPVGWKQVARLTGSGTAAGDFGWSVAIAGNTAVVNAPVFAQWGQSGDAGTYIFAKAGGRWHQVAKLKQVVKRCEACIENMTNYLVAISGTTVLVGTGSSALVSTKTPAGWKQTAEIEPSPDYGASSVGVSGTTAVVGQAGITCGGSAYVFTKTLSGWRQVTEINRRMCRPLGYFGDPVAISGRTIVVGASLGVPDGRVYVFTKTVAGWKQADVLKGSTGNFGFSVAVSGTTAIVGDGPAKGSGRAYVFEA